MTTSPIHVCSYLALVAALASEADYVFIPEDPVKTDWKDHLCKKLLQVQISRPKLTGFAQWD
jgi:6-phosphofructokinase 1